VTITDGIACEALVNCTGGQGAQNLKSSLDTVLADARKQLADAKAQMPPFLKETFAVGEQVLNGIQTQTVGSIMTVTANVPGSAKNTFEQLGKTLAAGMLPTGPMPFGNRRRAAGGMTPGMMPPGAATPGLTPGAMPAGAIPPGLQPGMVPPGSASLPPGALPANPAQGAAQPAATPIGAFPGTVPTTSPTPPMPPMNVPKP
jgi:hypothetical protein